jgi:DnaK suppressor protein
MELNIDYFHKELLNEKEKIEGDLRTIAQRNPDAPEDWNVKYPNLNIGLAEKGEIADQEEEYENRAPVELGLEDRIRDINAALEHIENGSYGICEVGKEQIPENRLRANPAARTCIEHATR